MSKSSSEAEYRAMAAIMCELQWIAYVMQDLSIAFSDPISLYYDSKVTINITANPVFHEQTKHLDIDCHIIINQYKNGFITLHHVSTNSKMFH